MITHLIVSFVYLLLFGKARTSHDYTVYTDITRTFSEAEIFCRSQGQSLALIKTNDDLDNFKKIMNSILYLDNDMFIGLQFDTSSSKFVWLDGDTLTLNTNWDVSIGEPNCHIQQCGGVYSYCVRITKITYLFRTVNCDRKHYTLCTEIVGETTVPDSTSAGYSEITTIQTGYSELTTISSTGYSELTTKSAGYSELTTKPVVYTPPLPYCSCSYCGSNSGVMAVVLSGNFTLEEIRQIVVDDFNRNIKPYISISKYDLSKTRRSRTSAPDPRWSSTYIGIFSVCIISVPIIIMVVIDMSNLCQR